MKLEIGDMLDDTIVFYDVPPWLEDDEVGLLIQQANESTDCVTGILWTLGDMDAGDMHSARGV